VAIAVALSDKAGVNLPWATVREAIGGAIRARATELALDSAPWPCDFAAAQNVKLKIPTGPVPKDEFILRPDILRAEAELKPSEIQDLADNLAEIRKAAGEAKLKLRVILELDTQGQRQDGGIVKRVNDLLAKISKEFYVK
jgi:hypothetical protein